MRRFLLFASLGFALVGQPKQTGEETGTRLVSYEVDGTVHSADLTYVDAAGEIKQKRIALPYTDQFFAPYGAFVSVLAQKRVLKKVDNSYVNPREVTIDNGKDGKLHVMIRVGGVPFREAETEEPFGIAKASGKVERK